MTVWDDDDAFDRIPLSNTCRSAICHHSYNITSHPDSSFNRFVSASALLTVAFNGVAGWVTPPPSTAAAATHQPTELIALWLTAQTDRQTDNKKQQQREIIRNHDDLIFIVKLPTHKIKLSTGVNWRGRRERILLLYSAFIQVSVDGILIKIPAVKEINGDKNQDAPIEYSNFQRWLRFVHDVTHLNMSQGVHSHILKSLIRRRTRTFGRNLEM